MNKVVIIKKDIAPVWVKVVGVLIVAATIYKIVSLTFFDVGLQVYFILNLIAAAIWTGKEIVVVDMNKQEIGEGFRVLGITYLDKEKFSGLEKIFINRVNTSQTFTHLAGSTAIHDELYKAFLKTAEGEKICIGEDRDKDKLIARLNTYNTVLKTVISS